MELKMNKELSEVKLPELAFNFDELEAELAERLTYYKTLVVSEDAIKGAKEDRAKLNSLIKALDDKRKDVKREYLAPYDAFENQIKKLTGMVKDAASAIDVQIKAFDEQRRNEKLEQIKSEYESIIPDDIKAIIPLNRIADSKWLNSTVTMKKVTEDLQAIAERIQQDLQALDAVDEQYAAAVRAKYMETLNLSMAMSYQKSLKEAAAAVEARKAAETKKEPEAIPVAAPQEKPVEKIPAGMVEMYTLRLEFSLTRDQASRLKEFLVTNRIDYRKI